jgi:hypothetical protein
MTIDDALDVVIAAGRAPRWRYLCLEHPDPAERAKHTAHVLRLASGDSPAAPPAPVDRSAGSSPATSWAPCCGGVPLP